MTGHQMRQSAADAAVRATWRSWRETLRRARARPRSRRRLHEFRIATRRLQAMEQLLAPARSGRQVIPSAGVEPAFRAAGKLRDIQLCVERLHALRNTHPVAGTIEAALRAQLPRRERKYERALREIDVTRCKRAVRALRANADLQRARRRLRSRQQRLRSTLRELPAHPTLAQLHRLRLRVKQLRYMQEWIAPAARESAPPELSYQLPLMQRKLGEIADTRALRRAVERWKPANKCDTRAQARLLRHIRPPRWNVTGKG
ncbi:MAG: CHAD domain-containing protein [Steroidobacteraceae bacterium]